MSIYSSLFRYRPRPARHPLEDFLSQGLADLLGRLPLEVVVDFVADVLLGGHAAGWREFVETRPKASLKWSTQVGALHGLTRGIMDLVLIVDGREAVVVESKIGAPVRSRRPEPDDLNSDSTDSEEIFPTADAGQLQVYGRWLASRRAEQEWKGALILLTHFTKSPADFGFGASNYGVPNLNVCHWRAVWSWAVGQGTKSRSASAVSAIKHKTVNRTLQESWRILCEEFAKFLEEQDMSNDYMTFHDFAAAELYTSSNVRIENTFGVVNERMASLRKELGSPKNLRSRV